MPFNFKKMMTCFFIGTSIFSIGNAFADTNAIQNKENDVKKIETKENNKKEEKSTPINNLRNADPRNDSDEKIPEIDTNNSFGVDVNMDRISKQYQIDPKTQQSIDTKIAKEALANELSNTIQRLQDINMKKTQYDDAFPKYSPEEIITLRQKRDATQKAKEERVTGPVKEIFDTVDLDTSQTEPVFIKVVPGYLSTLTFFDSTGAPWPVDYAQAGNKTFNITMAGKEGNVLNIDTSKLYDDANASIGLVGLDSNFTITLQANNNTNTTKKNFRIAERGPKAKKQISVGPGEVDNAPSEMYDIINGRYYRLEGAKQMKVSGVQADAILYNNFMYISSKHRLLSPARENSVSLPNGKTVYKIYPTSSLQFSVDGKMIFANIENEISRK